MTAINVSVPQVALLCGPPGLGKTTLAHIIARHAGYNVVEMNARYKYTLWMVIVDSVKSLIDMLASFKFKTFNS